MNRPRSRRYFLGTLGVPAGISLVAGRAAAADSYTMRLTLSTATDSLQAVSALRFASAIRRRSNGTLNVEVYPNNQLMGEQESITGLTTGVVDFAIQTAAFLQPLFPQFQVFDTPFLFKDINAVYRVLDGSIAEELFASLETKGILGLTWGITGFKKIETTPKPIVVPEDLKGMRIRIAGGAVYVATYQALGAFPVQIDNNEIFTAVSQHTIDALDLPLNGFTAGKFYTIMKHLAMANHIVTINPLLGSKRKIETLPMPLQRIVKEEGRALNAFWRSIYAKKVIDDLDTLRKNGVAFTDIQYAAFRKAVDPVYAMVQTKLGGNLLERVSRVANA